MRIRREPFFGMPEDLALLPESERERFEPSATPAYDAALQEHGMPDAEVFERYIMGPTHPDAVEKGIELPLGYHQHQAENRQQRRAAVATWIPPKVEKGEQPPTRRALWKQRQKQRRGKLDPELRRLQKADIHDRQNGATAQADRQLQVSPADADADRADQQRPEGSDRVR